MVDLDVLKNGYGIDYESLKKLFTLDNKNEYGIEDATQKGKLTTLRNLIRARVADGRSYNLTNHRLYKALDDAWDSTLKQITPTMLQNLIDSDMKPQAMMDTLKSWGVSPNDVMVEYEDVKTPNKTLKKVSVPSFFRVYCPLVRPYVMIRLSTIMNDRRLVPFLKYEPSISDKVNRTRCEVITQRVEAMSNQYGYFKIVEQAVLRMLHYGECFQFPVEPWNRVEQVLGKDSIYQGEDVKVDDEVVGKKAVVKEGIRYHLPHPTRTFYDRAHFPSTFNTDTGAMFAGYWRVVRYKEILSNADFYNLDRISIGDSKWFESNQNFFSNIYPCSLNFPPPLEDNSGKSKFDSEAHVGTSFYTTSMQDKGCMQTELFMKIVPKDYGISEYEYPVWFRFVVAGDDTIIYCVPMPYPPVIYYGYDSFEGRTLQTSLSLEILPYQDQFSNLLSQYLLTVKQNLFNLTLVDMDVLEENDAKSMESIGSKWWAGLNIKRFSLKKLFKQGAQARALYPEKLPQMDTQSITFAMKTMIEILERLLGMSSQEVGQAASHEQTREEVRNIAAHTTNRLRFTAGNVDIARDAMKNQLYLALMAYGSPEFYAQIAADPEITDKVLDDNGFTVEMTDERSGKRVVKTKDKTAIQVISFASSRDGDDRINNSELAATMGSWMVQLAANPMLAQAIGPDQFIKMANMIAKLSGYPRDFKLINRGQDQTPEEQQSQTMQQVTQFVQQTVQQAMQQLSGDVQNALKPIMDENHAQTDQIQTLAQAQAQMDQHMQQLEAVIAQTSQAAPPMQDMSPMPPQIVPQQSVVPPGVVPVVNPAVMQGVM